MALRNDSRQPQAWSGQFQYPHGSAQHPLPPADSLPRAAGHSECFHRETAHRVRWSQASGLWLQRLSVLHVAQSHADLSACVYRPACCITHCIGADPRQCEVIALVLSSLAESPSLYRMATKECPPPLSASSVASLPHFMEMHVCDLW